MRRLGFGVAGLRHYTPAAGRMAILSRTTGPEPRGDPIFDIVISGGRVVDGSGLPWFYGDVGVRDGRIAAVGPLAGAEARVRIDAKGKAVSPGFIDAHVHGDLALLADPLHEPAVRQGVTTYLLGQDG